MPGSSIIVSRQGHIRLVPPRTCIASWWVTRPTPAREAYRVCLHTAAYKRRGFSPFWGCSPHQRVRTKTFILHRQAGHGACGKKQGKLTFILHRQAGQQIPLRRLHHLAAAATRFRGSTSASPVGWSAGPTYSLHRMSSRTFTGSSGDAFRGRTSASPVGWSA